MQLPCNRLNEEPEDPRHQERRDSPGELTLLLADTKNPDRLHAVLRLAYDEMRVMAGGHLRRERPGHSWQRTVLANEACIRLIKSGTSFKNRRHFFGAASRAMRQVLLDHARRRNAQRRGRGWQRIDLQTAEEIGFEYASDLLDFDAVLSRLEKANPTLSQIVELRVFGGLSFREIAEMLGIGESTARRRCERAKYWLRTALAGRIQ